ncbi:hypothetical protein [Bacillus sp. FJAT-47783]|uniref:hypothetical protein n=1 Tax=Bacillus sp. FJAT-47783 TaxID=2922712 RepID=UPI001FAC1280|nr:hypothetical protein [Bacillus sp. FJAT-47783]
MNFFVLDERLRIKVPNVHKSFEQYDKKEQEEILLHWEQIRGKIPDRIKELEREINKKQAQLNEEENFEASCILNTEIAEIASIINELWIWYRM